MQTIAVPVKALEQAKSRLAPVLAPLERAALALAMVEDVVDACTAQSGWDTWVISADQTVLEGAARRGARPVPEEGRTLLRAVRQVEELAGARTRRSELAVVLGDLPLITAEALRSALATEAPVVAVPAVSDGGTNVLIRRPASAIAARFGRASFAKHRWAARRAGLRFEEAVLPDLAFDLDRAEDLTALVATARPCRSQTVCRELGLADRLRIRAEA